MSMIAALLFALAQPAAATVCEISADQRAGYLAMSYEDFDQTPGEGWRPLGETGACYTAAGDLIADYLLYSHASLEAYNVRVLRFHAGQMFAFAGETGRALDFFRASYSAPYQDGDRLDWNSYVDATIAFLEDDRDTLDAAYARLLLQTPFENGAIPNLNVGDGFLACYGEGYAKAYSAECMSDGRPQ
ncbi:hypothetical protein [Maricaulis sp.]|uniref:hypothetical protein n=1 Tax=Maricaulis sp. TaxID=1486257 RepID=UPI003A9221AC